MMKYLCSDLDDRTLTLAEALAHFQAHLHPGHIGRITAVDPSLLTVDYAVGSDGDVTLTDALAADLPAADRDAWLQALAPYRD